jgi:hypothetical protein
VTGWTRHSDGRYRNPDPRFAGIVVRRKWGGVFPWTAWFNDGAGALCGAGHTLAACIADINPGGQ